MLTTLQARYRTVMPYVVVLYIVSWAIGFLYLNYRLSFEWVALILLGAAILTGKVWPFLRDWGVFLVAVAAWQLTSPLATFFNFPVHAGEMITFDRALFGGVVPAQWLQQRLYHPGHLQWYDVLSVVMYSLHFLLPLSAGFVLWLINRKMYYRFALAFILCACAGFATYVFFPAMPPWMAAWRCAGGCHHPGAHPYLQGVYNLWSAIMQVWYNPNKGELGTGFLHMHYDQIGAMPSEHAMYPMLVLLFLRKQFGRWAYLFILYIAAVLFAITYSGQHYVADAVLGFVYAGAAYACVMHGIPLLVPRLSRWARALGIPRLVPSGSRIIPVTEAIDQAS